MAKIVALSVHIDKEIKKQCDEIYGELGTTLSAAIRVFMHRSVRVGGFPFDVRIDAPTGDKVTAMEDEKRPEEEKQRAKSPKRKHEPA